MSSGDLSSALPDVSGAGLGFTRVPTGMFTTAKWKIFEWFHEQSRKFGPQFRVTDQWLAEKFGVTREWVNACLRWLESLGYVVRERFGQGGRRLITFKIPFAAAKPKFKAGAGSPSKKRKVEQPRASASKPAAEPGDEPGDDENPQRRQQVARSILEVLRSTGWTLTVNENRDLVPKKLRPDADPHDVSSNTKVAIKAYKEDIIALLESARE